MVHKKGEDASLKRTRDLVDVKHPVKHRPGVGEEIKVQKSGSHENCQNGQGQLEKR